MNACEKETFDLNVENEIKTKSDTKIAALSVPDPISQLEGIRVNLVLPSGVAANHEVFYSAQPSDPVTSLYYKDDDSGRQQWWISRNRSGFSGYNITVVDGASKGWNLLLDGIYPHEWNLSLVKWEPLTIWSIEPAGNTNKYKIYTTKVTQNPIKSYSCYIRASYYNSGTVSCDETNNALGWWEIRPVEEFTLKNISYFIQPDDIFQTIPSFTDEVLVENDAPEKQNLTVSFTQKASESSSFSQTYGVSVTLSSSVKVGIPIIADAKLNTSVTTSASWSLGTSETHEDTRSYSFSLVVPGYTHYKATATVALYDASATYKATYTGNISGKEMILTGKWNGIKAGLVTYKIIDVTTGKCIKTFTGTPTNPVIL